jgi:hypothetical protein
MQDPVARKAKLVVRLAQLKQDETRVAGKIADVTTLIAEQDALIAKQQSAAE